MELELRCTLESFEGQLSAMAREKVALQKQAKELTGQCSTLRKQVWVSDRSRAPVVSERKLLVRRFFQALSASHDPPDERKIDVVATGRGITDSLGGTLIMGCYGKSVTTTIKRHWFGALVRFSRVRFMQLPPQYPGLSPSSQPPLDFPNFPGSN